MDQEPQIKRQSSFFVLVSKIDPSSQPVLFFPYPTSVQLQRQCPAGYEVREISASESDLRLTFAGTKRFLYNAITNSFRATNVRKTASSNTWNVFWGEHLKAQEFAALLPFQRVNHFPGSFELGRKDRLCSHLLRMRKKHPTAYADVIPETYLTANDYEKQQFLMRFHAEPNVVWILKPPNLSCGRGIKLVSANTHPAPKLSKKKAYVAQRYVANPFLINGLKFDLRVYVAVTSYDPLRIYLFHDGLVRFCTEKYSTSKSALQNPYGHLTNYSINKKNAAVFQKNHDNTQANEAQALSSSKWSLQMLFKYLHGQGKSRELESYQHALEDMIVKTIIAVEDKLASASNASGRRNGFELYGFDVLLEGENMKPRLLEVNIFPSLSSSSPMDKRIKTVLVSDLFQLVGIPFADPRREALQLDKAKQDRLHGIKRPQQSSAGGTTTIFRKEKEAQRRRHTFAELHTSNMMMSEIDGEDLQVVKEMEEEVHRQGHFKRIFPTAQSFDEYSELFDSLRYRTLLCMRWVQHTNQDGARRLLPTAKK
ncbi:Tubulin-tyrosine ligase family [Phytophthora palmivora]|uniref:Tubulin--tyrosine ligase-like protein 5 n=1 Tax=Phytophthora palmivora TaxID=4796 RepID=A0A2P4XV49_9STRA|nr:Tubulin-tyrosine ligase family [Phytophthora palmivora]